MYDTLSIADRLRNFEFSVAESQSASTTHSTGQACYFYTGVISTPVKWMPCSPYKYGRYVKLSILTPAGQTDLINIGELEVYGY